MCHGLWESWISTMVAWPCPNDFSHHGLACKRLLRQCTPGTSNGNNTWDLVFCMTRKLPAKFVDPAHRKGPQVVVHDKYTSRHRSQCCTLRWGFLKMGDTKCHSKWFVAMWTRKPMVRDTVIVKVSWLMQTCGDPTGPMQIRHIWKGPWFDRHVTSTRASGVSHWFPQRKVKRRFNVQVVTIIQQTQWIVATVFFHEFITVKYTFLGTCSILIENCNTQLPYWNTCTHPFVATTALRWGNATKAYISQMGRLHEHCRWFTYCFKTLEKVNGNNSKTKKQPNVVHHRWQPVHNPKLKKINKVSFRIARVPCA